MSFEAIFLLILWLGGTAVFSAIAYVASKSGTKYRNEKGEWIDDPDTNKPFVKQGFAQFAAAWFIIWGIMFILVGSDRWELWF